ncbi:HAD family hydrolase [Anoxybacillus flavithermus]|uniref:HAD family hydrolase n=1 Tax=Anoxybacillus flavithermus TaxID=33934 RepID=A0A2G5RNZ9_9BACL|nr:MULTISPECIES: HAD family hydrolase [Anoxybacillus]PIC04420.1 HAD family hydrolase [Anoxybacillus flavithermus]
MQTSKISAVIFDLWNTLVPMSNQVKQQAFKEISRALGFDPEVLEEPWKETRSRRETSNLSEYFYWLRRELNSNWSDENILKAMRVRKRIHGSAFQTPYIDAGNVLKTLKVHGFRTAIVSNCSSDVREMISSSMLEPLIDVVVLSSDIGIMKPDVRIYIHAASELGIPCSQCVYVGDGNDNELEGAAKAGMHPILIDRGDGRRWNGTHVKTLSAVLKEVGVN